MKWQTADGLAAALVVGGGVAAGFEWSGLLLLFAFFLSGSLLTQWSGGAGGRRDAGQVLANGGVAAAAAIAGGWPAFAGALAAATADTWATEIGAFSTVAPRLASRRARAAPIPDEAPVTSTLPVVALTRRRRRGASPGRPPGPPAVGVSRPPTRRHCPTPPLST